MTSDRWRSTSELLHTSDTDDREQGVTDWTSALTGELTVVAFQGERGAYGHAAIELLWKERVVALPCWSFDRVIVALQDGSASFGVLPVENTIIGPIPGVREAMAHAALEVVGQVRVEVRHCLLGSIGAQLGDIREVYSHPAALAQCTKFLATHRAMAAIEAYDTAGAARDVAARRRPDEAAIASAECAGRYGLDVLARDIGDASDNATYFAVVRRRTHA